MQLQFSVIVLCIVQFVFSEKRCVINRMGNDQCKSDVCFSHFKHVLEGHLERFDCQEEVGKLTRNSCFQLLNSTKQSSVCVGNATESHCCCLSTLPAEICATSQRKTSELTELWTKEQTLYLIFGHISLVIVVVLFGFLYKTSVNQWPLDNLKIPEDCRLYQVLLLKPLFLIFSLLLIYFPFKRNCMSHPEGIFQTPRLFLYQIFDAGLGPSLYFSFPLVFFLFDFTFYLNVKYSQNINKSGGLALSVFKLITVPLFVYETFIYSMDLWHKDRQPGYCRLGTAIWQFMLSHLFILLYHGLLVCQTVIICRMKSDIDWNKPSSPESSTHVATLLSTQTVETRIESDYSEMVYIHPRPFSVPRFGMNVLNVKNNRKEEWIVLRALLSTTGFYKVFPSKFFIPPGKQISMEVEYCTRADLHNVNHHVLLEWFSLPNGHPGVDLEKIWEKPYMVSQEKWQYFVLPIYLDESKFDVEQGTEDSLERV